MTYEASIVYHDWNYASETWDDCTLTWNDVRQHLLPHTWNDLKNTWNNIKSSWNSFVNSLTPWNIANLSWNDLNYTWDNEFIGSGLVLHSPLSQVFASIRWTCDVESIIQISEFIKSARKQNLSYTRTPVVLQRMK